MKCLTTIGVALVAISCVERARHEATDTVAAKSASAGQAIDTVRAPATPAEQPIAIQDNVSSPAPVGRGQTETSETPLARYVLLLSRTRDDVSSMVTLKFQLAERENRQHVWDVATVTDQNLAHRVLRADTASIVISREGGDGQADFFKLFLDPRSKKLVKKIDFSPTIGLDSIGDGQLAAALALPEAMAKELKRRDPQPRYGEPSDALLPTVLRAHPMPTSSYAEFARARPERVGDGYDSAHTAIEEKIGPFQVVGARIWFGKTFYDGEGTTGVGGVGYFDTSRSAYTFLTIPEVVHWSVSTLLVEDQSVWIGLVEHPEGPDYGGGLLRCDLKTGTTEKYPIDEVVLRIKRWNDRVYLATSRGLSVLEGGRLSDRYFVEPAIDKKFYLVHLNP
ncbi:MAG TPA: hypothetical protein VGQ98_02990 [Gemmatimonadaceae bacterium]|nr:hypothetical protein [Gemmatimonadaceae bacterium]